MSLEERFTDDLLKKVGLNTLTNDEIRMAGYNLIDEYQPLEQGDTNFLVALVDALPSTTEGDLYPLSFDPPLRRSVTLTFNTYFDREWYKGEKDTYKRLTSRSKPLFSL